MSTMSATLDESPRMGDMDLEEFRRVGREMVDAIVDYHAGLGDRRVLPAVRPRDAEAAFAFPMPTEGEHASRLLADWRDKVLPMSTALGSPRHFAFVNGSGAMVGILAEAMAATTNTNAGAWKLGPAAAAIEQQVLRWVAGFIGYPPDTGGILISGGTMANVTAILAALRHHAPYDSTPGGLQDPARTGRFTLYMSDHEGHVSVVRAADMLNLGRSSVRPVPSRPDLTLDPEALERMVVADRARGDLPFCVVAQLGSVNVGAVDPLAAIADVCARQRLWLHGDGAVGLLAAGLPATGPLFAGLERADSLSTDAHKWLGVPHDCGVLLVQHGERLRRAFSISAPYLRGESDAPDGPVDYMEQGPQMSRAFRALKVWMALRFFGSDGLRALMAKNVGLARRLHELVRDHPDFEVLHEPTLSLYCFRCVPHDLAPRRHEPAVAARLDQINDAIARDIQSSGLAFLMTTRLRGQVALRISIASQRTEAGDIDRTFEAIAAAGARTRRER